MSGGAGFAALLLGVQGQAVLPFWLVGPLALVTMVVIAGHLTAMRSAREVIPASRYRLRTVNGAMMLTVTPLLAFAFGVIPPAEAKLFVLVWFVCVGLLSVVVCLALVDAANNVRLVLVARARLRDEQAAELSALIGEGRAAEGSGADG